MPADVLKPESGSRIFAAVLWYDLFSRGARDWLRHNEKVREAVKQRVREYVTGPDVLSRAQGGTVLVPVRLLEHARFRLRDPGFQDLGNAEIDLYAGWRRQLGGGWDVDAGATYYVFVGGDGDTDYVEPYTTLSYLIGPLYASVGAKYAPSQAGTGDEDMLYVFGQADVSIPFRPWRISALLGHQDWGDFGSYWTWSLGVDWNVAGPHTVSAQYAKAGDSKGDSTRGVGTGNGAVEASGGDTGGFARGSESSARFALWRALFSTRMR